ncbi:hypothetical protein JKP88DRAFT_335441 [Tribonema minus]|uniref:Ion transport domain-containing protein n=1 Tax=Tribonema minus TaxID=303371 RepID=A0A835YU13_9STRA|nr:hypothetical protein JKP88DRAFT_335441 [Tribonema minus]
MAKDAVKAGSQLREEQREWAPSDSVAQSQRRMLQRSQSFPHVRRASSRFYEGALSAQQGGGGGARAAEQAPHQRITDTVARWAKGEAVEEDDDKWRVTRAALFVEDAWRRQTSVLPRLDTPGARLLFVWTQRLRRPKAAALAALLALAVFETVNMSVFTLHVSSCRASQPLNHAAESCMLRTLLPRILQPQWCHQGPENRCLWSTYPTLFEGEGRRPFLSHAQDMAIQTPLVLFLMAEAVLHKMLLAEKYIEKPYSRVIRHWLYDGFLLLTAADLVCQTQIRFVHCCGPRDRRAWTGRCVARCTASTNSECTPIAVHRLLLMRESRVGSQRSDGAPEHHRDSLVVPRAVCARQMLWPARPARLDWALRGALYCLNAPPTLHVVRMLVRQVIPGALDVWLLMAGYLACTGVLGYVAFQHLGNQTYFSSVIESMWNLLCLTTTVNFPDVMVEQYNVSRWSFVFFFCFVWVGVFFLVPLILTCIVKYTFLRCVRVSFLVPAILAMVFNIHTASQQELREVLEEERLYRFKQAFKELDVDAARHIPLSAVTALLSEIYACRSLAISKSTAARLQLAMDTAAEDVAPGTFDSEDLMTLLHKRLGNLPAASEVQVYAPWLWQSRAYQSLHHFMTAKTIVIALPPLLWYPGACQVLPAYDLVEMLLALLMLALLPYSITRCTTNVGALPCGVDMIQVTLLLACLAATLLKLIAHGFTNFWTRAQHRIELAISLGGAAVGVYSLATPEADTETVLHVAVVLRILHVVASLKWATHLSQLVAVTGQIMARSTPLMSTLAVWWYFMSCLGVFLFGGLICDPTAVPDDPSHTCDASDAARTTAYATGDYFNLNFNDFGSTTAYAAGDYFNLNFHDFGSALVTMFTLSVVNNWQVLTEQFVVTSGTRAARWFFIVNYYIGVACVLQVLNTFIITELYEKYQFRTPPKSARTRNRIDSHDSDSECSSAESDDAVLEDVAADDVREDTPLMRPHESHGESYGESYGASSQQCGPAKYRQVQLQQHRQQSPPAMPLNMSHLPQESVYSQCSNVGGYRNVDRAHNGPPDCAGLRRGFRRSASLGPRAMTMAIPPPSPPPPPRPASSGADAVRNLSLDRAAAADDAGGEESGGARGAGAGAAAAPSEALANAANAAARSPQQRSAVADALQPPAPASTVEGSASLDAELERADTAAAVAVRRARGLRSVVRAQMRQSHQLADVAMQVLLQRHNQQSDGGATGADAEQGHSMSSLLSRLRRTNDNV